LCGESSAYAEQRQKESSVFKVFAFLSKRSDITTEAFIDYYENHHVPLVLSLAALPTVY
jgi:EthD domain